MKRLTFLLAMLMFQLCDAAEHELYVRKVKDGDTMRADILMDFDVALVNQDLRAEDFDAWEATRIRKTVEITDEEIARGKEAKLYVEQLVRGAERVTVEPTGKKDAYGRWLVRFKIDGKPLADLMREGDHLRDDRFVQPSSFYRRRLTRLH
jgi:endonuclease YncB( thermonuclease family)